MEHDTFFKMSGVFAVPGEYEKDGKKYIKTAEELKDAAQRFPILPITFGHTNSSEPPSPKFQIGTMKQKWSATQNKALAKYWFDKKKMPEVLRSRALEGKGIPISAWLLSDTIDDDGTLHGMAYSHVAALDEESEDPVCPLTECGAFIVAESETSSRLIFIERLEDAEPKQPEPEPEAAPAEEEPTTVEEPEVEQPKTETPVEQKLAEPDEQVQPEEQAPPEPEIIIPPDVPVVQKPFTVDSEGNYVFVLDAHKQQEKTK